MYEKELILEKALEVFGEKGYYRTTLKEIALRSNARKTVVYKYFKSKDELYLELLNTARTLRQREVFENIGLTEDLRERLSRFVISLLRFSRNQKSHFKLLFTDIETENLEIRAKCTEIRSEFKERVYQILQDGIRQEKFRPVHPLIATVFLGKLIEGTVTMIEEEPSYAVDQMVLSLMDLIWNGLAKRSESPIKPGIDE